MIDTPSSTDSQAYLEDLMRAGQDAMKQFDDALASVAGVRTKDSLSSGRPFFPFALIADIQREDFKQLWQFWNSMFLQSFAGGAHSNVALAGGDKRFKDDAWREMPYYDLLKQSYLLGSRQLHEFVDSAQVDDKTKLQLRFYARQFIDAMSPSNFPATNPEVIRKAIETRSASLTDGLKNLIDDLQKGRITRVDESAFEVGRNLATTPGSVVFENELIQLIQYAPQTSEVEKTPLLFVPPCINKYYLLDLGMGNSLVEYAVAQGHRVFLISWRSAVPETGHLTWDDYLEMGPLRAIDVACPRILCGRDDPELRRGRPGRTATGQACDPHAADNHAGLFRHRRDRSSDRRGGRRLARGCDREGRHTSWKGVGFYLWHSTRQRSDLALCRRQLSEGCNA
jgi:polyhydroxyalkanoate synthase